MNKAQLVEAIESRMGSKKAAVDAVDAVVDTIVRAVSKGERVAISGFGTFEKTLRAARTGRNPRTGETVRIKKTNVPRFKAGAAFKGFVANPRSMPKSTTSGAVTSRVSATGTAAASTTTTARKTTTRATAAKKTTTRATAAKTTAAKKPAAAKKTTTKAAPKKTTTARATTRAAAKAPVKKTTARVAKKTTTRRTAK